MTKINFARDVLANEGLLKIQLYSINNNETTSMTDVLFSPLGMHDQIREFLDFLPK